MAAGRLRHRSQASSQQQGHGVWAPAMCRAASSGDSLECGSTPHRRRISHDLAGAISRISRVGHELKRVAERAFVSFAPGRGGTIRRQSGSAPPLSGAVSLLPPPRCSVRPNDVSGPDAEDVTWHSMAFQIEQGHPQPSSPDDLDRCAQELAEREDGIHMGPQQATWQWLRPGFHDEALDSPITAAPPARTPPFSGRINLGKAMRAAAPGRDPPESVPSMPGTLRCASSSSTAISQGSAAKPAACADAPFAVCNADRDQLQASMQSKDLWLKPGQIRLQRTPTGSEAQPPAGALVDRRSCDGYIRNAGFPQAATGTRACVLDEQQPPAEDRQPPRVSRGSPRGATAFPSQADDQSWRGHQQRFAGMLAPRFRGTWGQDVQHNVVRQRTQKTPADDFAHGVPACTNELQSFGHHPRDRGDNRITQPTATAHSDGSGCRNLIAGEKAGRRRSCGNSVFKPSLLLSTRQTLACRSASTPAPVARKTGAYTFSFKAAAEECMRVASYGRTSVSPSPAGRPKEFAALANPCPHGLQDCSLCGHGETRGTRSPSTRYPSSTATSQTPVPAQVTPRSRISDAEDACCADIPGSRSHIGTTGAPAPAEINTNLHAAPTRADCGDAASDSVCDFALASDVETTSDAAGKASRLTAASVPHVDVLTDTAEVDDVPQSPDARAKAQSKQQHRRWSRPSAREMGTDRSHPHAVVACGVRTPAASEDASQLDSRADVGFAWQMTPRPDIRPRLAEAPEETKQACNNHRLMDCPSPQRYHQDCRLFEHTPQLAPRSDIGRSQEDCQEDQISQRSAQMFTASRTAQSCHQDRRLKENMAQFAPRSDVGRSIDRRKETATGRQLRSPTESPRLNIVLHELRAPEHPSGRGRAPRKPEDDLCIALPKLSPHLLSMEQVGRHGQRTNGEEQTALGFGLDCVALELSPAPMSPDHTRRRVVRREVCDGQSVPLRNGRTTPPPLSPSQILSELLTAPMVPKEQRSEAEISAAVRTGAALERRPSPHGSPLLSPRGEAIILQTAPEAASEQRVKPIVVQPLIQSSWRHSESSRPLSAPPPHQPRWQYPDPSPPPRPGQLAFGPSAPHTQRHRPPAAQQVDEESRTSTRAAPAEKPGTPMQLLEQWSRPKLTGMERTAKPESQSVPDQNWEAASTLVFTFDEAHTTPMSHATFMQALLGQFQQRALPALHISQLDFQLAVGSVAATVLGDFAAIERLNEAVSRSAIIVMGSSGKLRDAADDADVGAGQPGEKLRKAHTIRMGKRGKLCGRRRPSLRKNRRMPDALQATGDTTNGAASSGASVEAAHTEERTPTPHSEDEHARFGAGDDGGEELTLLASPGLWFPEPAMNDGAEQPLGAVADAMRCSEAWPPSAARAGKKSDHLVGRADRSQGRRGSSSSASGSGTSILQFSATESDLLSMPRTPDFSTPERPEEGRYPNAAKRPFAELLESPGRQQQQAGQGALGLARGEPRWPAGSVASPQAADEAFAVTARATAAAEAAAAAASSAAAAAGAVAAGLQKAQKGHQPKSRRHRRPFRRGSCTSSSNGVADMEVSEPLVLEGGDDPLHDADAASSFPEAGSAGRRVDGRRARVDEEESMETIELARSREDTDVDQFGEEYWEQHMHELEEQVRIEAESAKRHPEGSQTRSQIASAQKAVDSFQPPVCVVSQPFPKPISRTSGGLAQCGKSDAVERREDHQDTAQRKKSIANVAHEVPVGTGGFEAAGIARGRKDEGQKSKMSENADGQEGAVGFREAAVARRCGSKDGGVRNGSGSHVASEAQMGTGVFEAAAVSSQYSKDSRDNPRISKSPVDRESQVCPEGIEAADLSRQSSADGGSRRTSFVRQGQDAASGFEAATISRRQSSDDGGSRKRSESPSSEVFYTGAEKLYGREEFLRRLQGKRAHALLLDETAAWTTQVEGRSTAPETVPHDKEEPCDAKQVLPEVLGNHRRSPQQSPDASSRTLPPKPPSPQPPPSPPTVVAQASPPTPESLIARPIVPSQRRSSSFRIAGAAAAPEDEEASKWRIQAEAWRKEASRREALRAVRAANQQVEPPAQILEAQTSQDSCTDAANCQAVPENDEQRGATRRRDSLLVDAASCQVEPDKPAKRNAMSRRQSLLETAPVWQTDFQKHEEGIASSRRNSVLAQPSAAGQAGAPMAELRAADVQPHDGTIATVSPDIPAREHTKDAAAAESNRKLQIDQWRQEALRREELRRQRRQSQEAQQQSQQQQRVSVERQKRSSLSEEPARAAEGAVGGDDLQSPVAHDRASLSPAGDTIDDVSDGGLRNRQFSFGLRPRKSMDAPPLAPPERRRSDAFAQRVRLDALRNDKTLDAPSKRRSIEAPPVAPPEERQNAAQGNPPLAPPEEGAVAPPPTPAVELALSPGAYGEDSPTSVCGKLSAPPPGADIAVQGRGGKRLSCSRRLGSDAAPGNPHSSSSSYQSGGNIDPSASEVASSDEGRHRRRRSVDDRVDPAIHWKADVFDSNAGANVYATEPTQKRAVAHPTQRRWHHGVIADSTLVGETIELHRSHDGRAQAEPILGGTWRTNLGSIATVSGTVVTWHDGSTCELLPLSEPAKYKLVMASEEHYATFQDDCLLWDDGDVWIKEALVDEDAIGCSGNRPHGISFDDAAPPSGHGGATGLSGPSSEVTVKESHDGHLPTTPALGEDGKPLLTAGRLPPGPPGAKPLRPKRPPVGSLRDPSDRLQNTAFPALSLPDQQPPG